MGKELDAITHRIMTPTPPSWKYYNQNATRSHCAHRLAYQLTINMNGVNKSMGQMLRYFTRLNGKKEAKNNTHKRLWILAAKGKRLFMN